MMSPVTEYIVQTAQKAILANKMVEVCIEELGWIRIAEIDTRQEEAIVYFKPWGANGSRVWARAERLVALRTAE